MILSSLWGRILFKRSLKIFERAFDGVLTGRQFGLELLSSPVCPHLLTVDGDRGPVVHVLLLHGHAVLLREVRT